MSRCKYKPGIQVGDFTLIRQTDPKHWLCQCTCGNQVNVPVEYFSKGRTHCGCKKEVRVTRETLYDLYINKRMNIEQVAKEVGMGTSTICRYIQNYNIDRNERYTLLKKNNTVESIPGRKPYKLLGRRIGDLIVDSYAGVKEKQHIFRCECTCGGTIDVTERDLYARKSMSCGCKGPTFIADEVCKWLDSHNVSYTRNFETTSNASRPIIFDVLVSGQVILIIDCEGPVFYEVIQKSPRTFGIDRQVEDIIAKKQSFCASNGIPYRLIMAEDLEDLNNILMPYLKDTEKWKIE